MTDAAPIWLVRATDVGFDVFREHGIVALNCKVRRDITTLTPEQIEESGSSRRHARELARVQHLDPGHLVIATHGRRRDVLIGTVTEEYVFRDDLIPEHPHTFEVAWGKQIPRLALDEAGMPWPPRAVVAITDVDLPPAALDVVKRAAAGEEFGTPRRSRLGRTPPDTRTSAVRRQAVGISGPKLLARVRRRTGGPVSWVDPAFADEERTVPCPVDRCHDHTRHRYWLPIELHAPRPDGPNLLVVGVNPTCPDVDHPRNQTYRQVRRLAAGIGAASCGMVNLATRRTGNVSELMSVGGELVGPRHAVMLKKAFEQADLAVLAHGRIEGSRRSALEPLRERLMSLVDAERTRGLVVAQVGEFPSHPWPWSTTVPGGLEDLVAVLSEAVGSPGEIAG
jgi:hypothetical protein